MMKHWHMGIIGCGWAGKQHARDGTVDEAMRMFK